jgi:hypothetical protein
MAEFYPKTPDFQGLSLCWAGPGVELSPFPRPRGFGQHFGQHCGVRLEADVINRTAPQLGALLGPQLVAADRFKILAG